MGYVLGIDLGTSSLKGLILNKEGELIASLSEEYPIINSKSGYSEQDPNEWIKACKKVLEKLIRQVPSIKSNLEGISFSGQMHSLVLLDKNHKVLRNSILWNDVRTTDQCQKIMDIAQDDILELTKNIALEGFTLPKILWVQEHEPEIWEQTYHILLPKDYLRFWLTNELYMDYSDAAGTLMMDVENKKWSKTILDTFSIPMDLLPPLTSSINQIGTLREEIKNMYQLEKEIKVFAGGADNACAALGAGILSSDIGLVSIGTSGVFLSYEASNIPNYNGKLHLFNYVDSESYYSMGVTLAAGQSLSWFRSLFGEEIRFEELLRNIGHVKLGSNGLLFTPYLNGERTPHVDSTIRGSFIGLDASHNRDHLTRSVVEGITFSLKDSQELMGTMAHSKMKKIISVGGGAKNKEWLQIQADIFNTEIMTLEIEQGPGLGAAMIAAVGCGWFDSLESCKEVFVSYKESVLPNPKNVEVYREIYQIYTQIYPKTKQLNIELQKFK